MTGVTGAKMDNYPPLNGETVTLCTPYIFLHLTRNAAELMDQGSPGAAS